MFVSRTTWCAALTLVLSMVAAAAPVPVKVDYSKTELPVPKDVIAVVHVNGVGAVRDRMGKLLEAALPAKAAKFKKDFDAALAESLNNRDLSALRSDGRLYVAVLSLDGVGQGTMPIAALLPTDLKGFRDKLLTADERKTYDIGKGGVATVELDGTESFVVELATLGYVAVSPNKATAELFAKKFDPLTGGMIGEPVASTVLGSDLSVYVNLDVVNDKYGDQIRGFRDLLNNLLGMGGVPGVDPAQLDAAKVMVSGMFQAVEDGKGFGLGIEFRPDALAIRGEMSFRTDTESGRFLSSEKATPLKSLDSLPRGHAIYSASKIGPSVTKALLTLSKEFTVADDEKAAELVTSYSNLFAEGAAEGAVTVGSGITRGLTAMSPKDPAKLAASYLAALRALPKGARYSNVPLKEQPAVKEADQTHAGFKLNKATLKLDFEAAVADLPDEDFKKSAIESMKNFVDETTTYWFGTDGKRYVQVVAKDWDTARKLLDEYLDAKETVGTDAAFQAVRKGLPTEATQVISVEVNATISGLGAAFKLMLEAMPGFPGGEIPKLKPVKGQAPAFVGAAVVLKPGSAGFAAVAPAAAVNAAYALLKPVFEQDQ